MQLRTMNSNTNYVGASFVTERSAHIVLIERMPHAEQGYRKTGQFKSQGFLHFNVIEPHHYYTAKACGRNSQVDILNGCPSLKINVTCPSKAVGLLTHEMINCRLSLSHDCDDGRSVFQPRLVA
jgi:hypothetical protein